MFNDALLTIGATAMTDAVTHVSLHTTGAVTSSTGESSAARQPITWTVDGDGDATAGPINFTGGASEGAVVRVGYWSALTGGTYYGGALLTGDAAFNTDGEYTVDSITETGTSS